VAEGVRIRSCTKSDLRLEMRKVKYILDLSGARETERIRAEKEEHRKKVNLERHITRCNAKTRLEFDAVGPDESLSEDAIRVIETFP
jgi:hypothetical protein